MFLLLFAPTLGLIVIRHRFPLLLSQRGIALIGRSPRIPASQMIPQILLLMSVSLDSYMTSVLMSSQVVVEFVSALIKGVDTKRGDRILPFGVGVT